MAILSKCVIQLLLLHMTHNLIHSTVDNEIVVNILLKSSALKHSKILKRSKTINIFFIRNAFSFAINNSVIGNIMFKQEIFYNRSTNRAAFCAQQCMSLPTLFLLCISNNYPFSYFKDLSKSRQRVGILASRKSS